MLCVFWYLNDNVSCNNDGVPFHHHVNFQVLRILIKVKLPLNTNLWRFPINTDKKFKKIK